MKLSDGKGLRSGKWFANEIFRADDINLGMEFAYGNALDIMGNLTYQDNDVILKGMELVWSTVMTCVLKAGMAVSFQGKYYTAEAWGFVASAGDVFTVLIPEDLNVAFNVGTAYDRIDILEVRPKLTDYEQKARQFKDPITGFISSTLTNTKAHIYYEHQILQGTALAKEVASWTVNSATLGSDVAGKYVLFNTHLGAYYIWYDTGSSTDPLVASRTGVRVAVNTGDAYDAIALATRTALTNALGVTLGIAEIIVGGAGGTFSSTINKYTNVTDATNGDMTTYFDAISITQGNGAPASTAGWIKLAEVYIPASASAIGQLSILDTDESGAWNGGPLSTIRALKSVLNQLRCSDTLAVGDGVGAGFGNIHKISNGVKKQAQITATGANLKYQMVLVGGPYKRFIYSVNVSSAHVWGPIDFDENMIMYFTMYSDASGLGGRAAILTDSVVAIPWYGASTISTQRGTFGAERHPSAIGRTGPYVIESVAGYTSIDAMALDSTHFIVSYNTISQSKVICGLDGGSSFSYGSAVNVGAASVKEMYLAKLDSTHFIVVDATGDAYIGTLSGTTISLSSAFPWDGTIGAGTMRIATLDSKHFVLYWYNTAPSVQMLIGTLDAGYTTITGLTNAPVDIPFSNVDTSKISLCVVPGTSFGLIVGNGEKLRRIIVDPVTYTPLIEAELSPGVNVVTTNEGIAAFDKNLYVMNFDGTSSYPQLYCGNPLTFMGISGGVYAAGGLGFAVSKGICQLNTPPNDPIPVAGLAMGLRQNGKMGTVSTKTEWYLTELGVSANRGSILLT